MDANDERRREYWKRRSTVRRLASSTTGSGLEVERMQDRALWAHLEQSLTLLCTHLAMSASPEMFKTALRAWDCYGELVSRGTQLTLLDPADYSPADRWPFEEG